MGNRGIYDIITDRWLVESFVIYRSIVILWSAITKEGEVRKRWL